MKLINLIAQGKLIEAKEVVFERLNKIASNELSKVTVVTGANMFEEVEELEEANKSSNRIKQGRVIKIRRRIRRNAKGRIVLQRNVRKSAIKGYRVSGNTVKRITAIQRINKSRKLKRYWKSKGRAKLGRTLLKRKMSNIRRKSMGIR